MKISTRKLASAAVVGAAYAALTLLLAPISFGLVQFRVSEALCILPAFVPFTAWGLWAGCAIANLAGGYGIPDIVFGSLATLGASLCMAAIAKTHELLEETMPCSMCKRLIINAGITQVVVRTGSESHKVIHVRDWVFNDDSLPTGI